MKYSLMVLAAAMFYCSTHASDSTNTGLRKNAIVLEGGGKGPKYSLGYERLFRYGNTFNWTFGAGLSVYRNNLSVPLSVTAFTKGIRHHLEFGVGVTPYIQKVSYLFKPGNISDKQLYLFPLLGYRHQKNSGRLLLKAGVSPYLFMDPPSDHFWNFTPEIKMGAYLAAGILF
jgi:hypothetical protein